PRSSHRPAIQRRRCPDLETHPLPGDASRGVAATSNAQTGQLRKPRGPHDFPSHVPFGIVRARSMPHISVVTPVYCAEDCLEELYRRLVAALSNHDFEIVMVEDCGGDRSWQIITELAKKDSRVKGI